MTDTRTELTSAEKLIATNGARVRLKNPIEVYHLGDFAPGLTGTVEQVDITNGPIMAEVKLDQNFECLDEWQNCLQVGINEEECITVFSDWELIEEENHAG